MIELEDDVMYRKGADKRKDSVGLDISYLVR